MKNDVRAHALNKCCRATGDRPRLALACSSIRFEIARADPVTQLLHFCSDLRCTTAVDIAQAMLWTNTRPTSRR
jgi:hypothetical protein